MTDGSSVGSDPGPIDGPEPGPLKEIMVQAGLELLDSRGLTLTFESISYAKVFEYLWSEYQVQITRGSVHERIWATHNEFRRDVLTESVAYFPRGRFRQALLGSNMENPTRFAESLGSRMAITMTASPALEQFQSVKALASHFDDPAMTETLQQLLDERSETALADTRAELPSVLARLGLVGKAALGLTSDEASDLFCLLTASLREGGELNYHAGSHDITAQVGFASIPSDAADSWRILSIGIKCLLDFLYEPTSGSVETIVPAPQHRPPKHPDIEAEAGRSSLPGSARRTRAQLKGLVLTTAVELLLQGVLELRAELLGYKSVIAHIKKTQGFTVHRASVHGRIWKSNDDYRLEVLARSIAVTAEPLPGLADAMHTTQRVLCKDGTTDWQQTASQFIRRSMESLAGVSAESVAYRRLLQIKAAVADQEESAAKTTLSVAIQDADRKRMLRNRVAVKANLLDHGFHVRSETGLTEDEALELLQTLTATTITGITFNELAGISSATSQVQLPDPTRDGELENWTPAGIAMRAYFEQLYEPNDQPVTV